MWDDARQLDAIAKGLALLSVAALLWSAVAWGARQPPFAFREVVVRGTLDRVDAAQLESVVRRELAGTFFTMSLESARVSLGKLPWVRNVALRRQWPQRLEVTIEEHVPFGRWNDTALVDTFGGVFAAEYDGALPQFAGPQDRSAEVAQRYREARAALGPLGLEVDVVRVSARGGWQIGAKGPSTRLAIELGREEPSAQLERFVAAYDRTIAALARAGTRVEHVDLRYRNGFAVRVPGFRERAPKKKDA
jgi:cell division protein FtsQ